MKKDLTTNKPVESDASPETLPMMNAGGDFNVLPNLIVERLCRRTTAVAARQSEGASRHGHRPGAVGGCSRSEFAGNVSGTGGEVVCDVFYNNALEPSVGMTERFVATRNRCTIAVAARSSLAALVGADAMDDEEIARKAFEFQAKARDFGMMELPGYMEWSEKKLAAGGAEAFIAHLDATSMWLTPEEAAKITEKDYEEMYDDLVESLARAEREG